MDHRRSEDPSQTTDARLADRRSLEIKTETAFQTTIGVHHPPSTRLRWTPMLHFIYTGSRILTVQDVIPSGPTQMSEDGQQVRFVRTATSSKYRAYPNLGALVAAQGTEGEGEDKDDYRYVEDWPLILRPGERVRVAVDQEYAITLDDSPMTFASHDHTLTVLAAYFHLKPLGDGVGGRSVLLPTRIICDDDDWEMAVPYVILPVGATVRLPSPEAAAEYRERDELV